MKLTAYRAIMGMMMTGMLGMISCSTENFSERDMLIRFKAGLEPSTRAPIESDATGLVTSGDVAGIQILRGKDGTAPAFNQLASPITTATLDGAGVMTTADAMRFNVDGTTAHFMAYYPQAETFTGGLENLKLTWTIDGYTDLIVAGKASKSYSVAESNVVSMDFEHLLARVELKVVAVDDVNGALYQKVTMAEITVPNKVEVQISASGEFQASCTSQAANSEDWQTLDFGELELSTTGKISESGIMIWPDANRIKDGVIKIKFAGFSDEGAKAYTLNNLRLEAGKKTLIVATVKGGEALHITTTIETWNAVDTGNSWVTE